MMLDTLDDIWMHFLRVSPHACFTAAYLMSAKARHADLFQGSLRNRGARFKETCFRDFPRFGVLGSKRPSAPLTTATCILVAM